MQRFTCYYARIMLDAFALLLFLKIFQHNSLKHIIITTQRGGGGTHASSCGYTT